MATSLSQATTALPAPGEIANSRSFRCGVSTRMGISRESVWAEALVIAKRNVSVWGWGFSYSPSADTSHTTSARAPGPSTAIVGGGTDSNDTRLEAVRVELSEARHELGHLELQRAETDRLLDRFSRVITNWWGINL